MLQYNTGEYLMTDDGRDAQASETMGGPKPAKLAALQSTRAAPAQMPEAASWVNSLIDRYHNTLMKFLRERLFNQDEAEDVAQEVYYRMIRIEEPGSLRHPCAFLLQTASNLLKDINRYRQRRCADTHIEFEEQSIPVDGLPHGFGSPENALINSEELQQVMTSLSELSPRCQVIFMMHRIDGQTYKDIAMELGISVSRVEKHLMRAIKHLRKNFMVMANGRISGSSTGEH